MLPVRDLWHSFSENGSPSKCAQNSAACLAVRTMGKSCWAEAMKPHAILALRTVERLLRFDAVSDLGADAWNAVPLPP